MSRLAQRIARQANVSGCFLENHAGVLAAGVGHHQVTAELVLDLLGRLDDRLQDLFQGDLGVELSEVRADVATHLVHPVTLPAGRRGEQGLAPDIAAAAAQGLEITHQVRGAPVADKRSRFDRNRFGNRVLRQETLQILDNVHHSVHRPPVIGKRADEGIFPGLGRHFEHQSLVLTRLQQS